MGKHEAPPTRPNVAQVRHSAKVHAGHIVGIVVTHTAAFAVFVKVVAPALAGVGIDGGH